MRASVVEARQVWYWTATASIVAGALLVFGSVFYQLDAMKMVSGVFRSGTLLNPEQYNITFQQDGKTASVSVLETQDQSKMLIRTNGKTDAGMLVHRDQAEGLSEFDDSTTMLLMGVLPWAAHPEAKNAAVIGMGSGISSQTLLHFPSLERVDTIEIEPAMVAGAGFFGEHVDKVFNDPRSHIHIEDAKTYFTNHQARYDIISSEPSNPWVSGVASLFSSEFYARVVQHLEPNGIFAQWLHTYEIDVELVVSVLKAMTPYFADYAAYSTLRGDIVILAKPEGQLPTTFADVFAIPDIAKELNYVHIHHLEDLYTRQIADKSIIDALMSAYPIKANSDYFPILDLRAARTRFLKKRADALYNIRSFPAPFWQLLLEQDLETRWLNISDNRLFWLSNKTYTAMGIREYLLAIQQSQPPVISEHLSSRDLQLIQSFISIQQQCYPDTVLRAWLPNFEQIIIDTLPYLPPEQMQVIWTVVETAPCFDELSPRIHQWLALYQAIANFDPQRITPLVIALLENSEADDNTIRRSRTNEYLVTVGLLAYLHAEDYTEALALWRRYQADETLGIELRIVVAMLSQKLYPTQ